MTTTIIITICSLVLLAYLFDITSSKTRIPSVILLLTLGWLVRQTADFFEINVPDLTSVLPILGTVGLILIVLEGSLELELNGSKLAVLRKSFFMSLLPMLLLSFGLAFVLFKIGNYPLKVCLTNSIPLCIISSAIAIPSVKNLAKEKSEFVIYESSLSDIFGVILFNFFALNEQITTDSYYHFLMELVTIIILSFVTTAILSYLLHKIDHHVKFVPITLLVILIYGISKVYHLPSLIFIMVFGLFLGNLDEMKQWKWIQKLHPDELQVEITKFKEITIEGAFLIRALFFLLFGYLIKTEEILNTDTLPLAAGIVTATILLRAAFLKIFGISLKPLLFVAPRGLITILLFLSIPSAQAIPLVNNSLIIQVIVLMALFMMFGLMTNGKKKEEAEL